MKVAAQVLLHAEEPGSAARGRRGIAGGLRRLGEIPLGTILVEGHGAIVRHARRATQQVRSGRLDGRTPLPGHATHQGPKDTEDTEDMKRRWIAARLGEARIAAVASLADTGGPYIIRLRGGTRATDQSAADDP